MKITVEITPTKRCTPTGQPLGGASDLPNNERGTGLFENAALVRAARESVFATTTTAARCWVRAADHLAAGRPPVFSTGSPTHQLPEIIDLAPDLCEINPEVQVPSNARPEIGFAADRTEDAGRN